MVWRTGPRPGLSRPACVGPGTAWGDYASVWPRECEVDVVRLGWEDGDRDEEG